MFEHCGFVTIPELNEQGCRNLAFYKVVRKVGSHYDVVREHVRCVEHVGPTVNAIRGDYDTGRLSHVEQLR